uniref:Amidase domain-containing protein n=1 Tax=Bionectria ochroleuca TaxID=29856 RepID=A0A0B7JZY2_BIOOC
MVSLQTVVIAGIHYLIHPQKLGTITAIINPDSILPVTLLATHEIFSDDLEALLAGLDAVDDVFIPAFGSVLVEKAAENDRHADPSKLGITRDIFQLNSSDSLLQGFNDLPSGPYILHGPNLYQAWRLYEDEYDAFVFGVISEDVNAPEQFRVLNALSTNGLHKSIPVPSRLYHRHPSPSKPLSGVRVSICDSASLEGVGTTLSSASWELLHPEPAEESAHFVRRLIDLGAVIVGKTKVPPMESGQEWVDVPAPWNPRADGYQRADDSSPGAVTAVAGYPWLQHALGEHVVGALANTAMPGGVYSLRLPLPTVPKLEDIPRPEGVEIISRELQSLHEVAQAVLGPGSPESERPQANRLLYLTDLSPELPTEQSKSFEKLISVLESALKLKAEYTSLAALWASQPPNGFGDVSLGDFMKLAPFRSLCYREAQKYRQFQKDYREKFHREAFVERNTRFRWDYGDKVTEDQNILDLSHIGVLRSWFHDTILNGNPTTLVVFPRGVSQPQYRRDKLDDPKVIEGLTYELLPVLLDSPHLVLPFDQVPFESIISGRAEQLPVSASIIGGDSWTDLIQTVDGALKSAGWPTELSVGRLALPLAERSILEATLGEAQAEL